MFAASTYEEILRVESGIDHPEIVVFLFVKPYEKEILQEFEYIHYNSGDICSVYAIGYTNDFDKATEASYREVDVPGFSKWYYSARAFTDFKDKLQKRINWRYDGDAEILVLRNNPGGKDVLNFQNYVAIDVKYGIKSGYIRSFQSFMESLVRVSESISEEIASNDGESIIRIKSVLADTIRECKNQYMDYNKIIDDRGFYRCANTIKS